MDKIYIGDQRKVWCETCGGLSNYDPKFKKNLIDERVTHACCRDCDVKYRLYKGIDIAQTGCHEFQGSTRGNGYGQIKVDGELQYAHRVAYELSNGYFGIKSNGGLEHAYGVSYELSNGQYGKHKTMVVRHICDNPKCININHLEIGDSSENTHDCISRGRFVKNKGVKKSTLGIIKEHQPAALNTIFDLSGMDHSSIKRAVTELKNSGLIKVAYTGECEVMGLPVPYYALPDWEPNTDERMEGAND